MNDIDVIKSTVRFYPEIVPHLLGRARWIAYSVGGHKVEGDYPIKTYDYFLTVLERLVRSVYSGLLGGEFIDIMANLIQGQIMQAYEQAWLDEGNLLPLPDFLQKAAESKILGQFDYVDQFFRDIVDAKIDGTSIEPLIARARLWANRFNEAYSDAMAKIVLELGGKLVWKLGQTEEHCETCAALDGVVDYAVEWESRGLHPQNAPNPHLDCGGWRCDCSLLPTDSRRSRGGLQGKGF